MKNVTKKIQDTQNNNATTTPKAYLATYSLA
jgi:hypothetical protein